jgi:hypothetical protein
MNPPLDMEVLKVQPAVELVNCALVASFERVPPRSKCSIPKVGLLQGCCDLIFLVEGIVHILELGAINCLACLSSDSVQWKKQVCSLSTIFTTRSLVP